MPPSCDILSNYKFFLIGRFAFEFPKLHDPVFLIWQCQEKEMSLLIRGSGPWAPLFHTVGNLVLYILQLQGQP